MRRDPSARDLPDARRANYVHAIGLIVVGVFLGQFIVGRFDAARMARAEVARDVSPRGPLTDGEQSTIRLFETASPSVVYVTSKTIVQDRLSAEPTAVPNGAGSGFVWDDLGHIVTNFHVVAQYVQGDASFTVTFADQTTYDAEVVGLAPNNDLAVLHIDAPKDKLRALLLGTSADLKAGQSVLAIGNPFGLDKTLTSGIVSALGRTIMSPSRFPIEDVIQTDAAINPGNSGGPLLDSAGRLIGVNTQIASPSGSNAGIGFAIPVDTVNRIVPAMIRNYKPGRPGMPTRAVLGIAKLLDPQTNAIVMDRLKISGVVMLGLKGDAGAAAAGLRAAKRNADGTVDFGDVLLEVAGRKITNPSDLAITLARHDPGQTVDVKVWNNGVERTVPVKLSSSE